MSKPLVSVVIPTFNSEETIELCLRSIKAQTYQHIETIIVDRYSWDKTIEKAKKFNVKILLRGPERSAQKNWGAANANAPFLLFIDSDMELNPKVVEECVDVSLKKGADAVIIPQVSIAKNFWSECRKIERESFIGNELIETPRFFKKEVFNSVGGYDEKLSYGEDSDLYLRIKSKRYRILRIQSEIKHYEGDLFLKKIILKAYYYGKNLPAFIKKNPSFAVKKYSPLHQVYISNISLLLKNPKQFLGIIFLKFLEYITYSIGMLAYLLQKQS